MSATLFDRFRAAVLSLLLVVAFALPAYAGAFEDAVAKFANNTLLPLYRHFGRLRARFQEPSSRPETSGQCTNGVAVTIREPYLSRDHTERLLVHLGLALSYHDGAISFRSGAIK